MVMPFATTFIVVIIAVNQQKMRRRQFRQREVIEYQNRQLQKNNRLIERKNSQMSSDLRLARTIQNNLIPLDPPVISGVEFHPAYLPVEELGGDMYDFIPFSGQSRVGIFISDVSGHGVPAALISAMVKALVHNAGNEKNGCSEFLSFLNSRLAGLAYNNFVTALYGIYEPPTRVLRFARAGHPYPCLIEAAGGVRELRSNGRFLGVMNENQCEESSITLHPGDKVLFFTDGLTDAVNARGEIFESTLFGDILTRMKDVPAETMVSTIIEKLFQFCDGGRINDDICMVGMEATR